MLYVITGRDVAQSGERRKRVRAEHLARARALLEAGRMVIAGPCPALDSPDPGPAGFTGSVIIAEFDSLEDARAWIAADPYVTTGVFEAWDVKPFLQVLP